MDTVDITANAWARMNTAQKKEMLRTLGYSETFAEAKTMNELVRRGGGAVAHDVHKTVKLWASRNPNTNIIWR